MIAHNVPDEPDQHDLADRREQDDWIRVGMERGWCGPPVCAVHDGIPSSPDEDEEMEACDPCLHIIRLYYNAEHKDDIEAHHSPSRWRKDSMY